MKNPIWILLVVDLIALLFCVYAVATDGWTSASTTVFYTLGIFGIPSLIWIVYNAITKTK